MPIPYKKLECYEVAGMIFTCKSKWNTLEEWVNHDGEKMIVSFDQNQMERVLAASPIGESCGISTTMSIVKASPNIILAIDKHNKEQVKP